MRLTSSDDSAPSFTDLKFLARKLGLPLLRPAANGFRLDTSQTYGSSKDGDTYRTTMIRLDWTDQATRRISTLSSLDTLTFNQLRSTAFWYPQNMNWDQHALSSPPEAIPAELLIDEETKPGTAIRIGEFTLIAAPYDQGHVYITLTASATIENAFVRAS